MKWEVIIFCLMQIVPAMLAFKAGKSMYGVACLFWGAGNVFAFLGSK